MWPSNGAKPGWRNQGLFQSTDAWMVLSSTQAFMASYMRNTLGSYPGAWSMATCLFGWARVAVTFWIEGVGSFMPLGVKTARNAVVLSRHEQSI